jgi:hypothetical protein
MVIGLKPGDRLWACRCAVLTSDHGLQLNPETLDRCPRCSCPKPERPETLRLLLDSERESHRLNCELLTEQRDLERSRFAHWADALQALHVRIATQPSDWGHLRHQVQSQLASAAHLFRQYAAGLPSPQNYRRRAEAAEAEVKALRNRLRRYEDPAAATRDSRHPAMPGGVP